MINNELFNVDTFKDDLTENENKISVEKLENFVNILENGMTNWLNEFNWTKDKLFKINADNEKLETFTCPFNQSHKNISKKKFQSHINKCRLKCKSYTKQDIIDYSKLPDVYSPYQVVIDEKVQLDLLKNVNSASLNDNKHLLPIPFDPAIYREKNQPKNSNDRDVSLTNNHLFVNYNAQERLALHEYALKQSKFLGYSQVIEKNEIDFEEDSLKNSSNEPNTSANLASETKEIKRRPKSYRTGKHKTHTEAIRDLIRVQMDFLQKDNQNIPDEDASEAHKRKRSLSQSRSRSNDSKTLNESYKVSSKKSKNKKSSKKKSKDKHKTDF